MKRFLRGFLCIVLIVVIVIAIYFAHKYSYIETVTISVLNESSEYVVIEPYRYDVNKIKRYYMFSNTLSRVKTNKKMECKYKIDVNETDFICYDGNSDYLATLSKRLDTVDDVKAKVKSKDLKAIGDNKYEVKTFKMQKAFAKMLIDLY